MKTNRHFIILLFVLCTFSSLFASSGSFIQNNLELAKQRAKQEGKLIMVDFWAHWCNPCQWMDEQTFSKQHVLDYLNENYISVRVDIDNLEGYAHKEAYNIRYLPTLLILNDQGELIKKYEESFAPSKLIELLKMHNKSNNSSQVYANISAEQYAPNTPVKDYQAARPAPAYQPALSSDFPDRATTTATEVPQQFASSTTTSVTTEDYTISSPAKTEEPIRETTSTFTPASTNYAAPVSNTPATSNSHLGIYEFNVKPAPKNGFSIQVGAYYEYGNVLTEVAVFQEKYQKAIFVHISELNGMPCYKVLIGHYGTRTSANQQKAFLKERGLDCFVKEMSTM